VSGQSVKRGIVPSLSNLQNWPPVRSMETRRDVNPNPNDGCIQCRSAVCCGASSESKMDIPVYMKGNAVVSLFLMILSSRASSAQADVATGRISGRR